MEWPSQCSRRAWARCDGRRNRNAEARETSNAFVSGLSIAFSGIIMKTATLLEDTQEDTMNRLRITGALSLRSPLLGNL